MTPTLTHPIQKLLPAGIALLLATATPAPAVEMIQVSSPDPILEPWRWTAFDRSSGLSGRVRDIFEDRDGNIWFATEQGAQRYDGVQWITYTTEDALPFRLRRPHFL